MGRYAVTTAIATILVCVVTVPLALVGAYGVTDDHASAPRLGDVPLPDGWSRRQLETADCSGSGGTFCIFAVLGPRRSSARTAAESEYRDYLLREGWKRVEAPVGPVFQRGRIGEETVLTVGGDSDRTYHVDTYGEPPHASDIVVEAAFADWGAASRASLGRRIIAVAVAITVAPGAIVALWAAAHRRRGRRADVRPPGEAAASAAEG